MSSSSLKFVVLEMDRHKGFGFLRISSVLITGTPFSELSTSVPKIRARMTVDDRFTRGSNAIGTITSPVP